MLRHILVRLLLIIPTLWVISLIAFGLSNMTPGDSVAQLLELEGVSMSDDRVSQQAYTEAYKTKRKELNKHLPAFYFAIQPNHYLSHNELESIAYHQREAAEKLQEKGFSSETIIPYLGRLHSLESKLSALPDSLISTYNKSYKNAVFALDQAQDLRSLRKSLVDLANDFQDETIVEDVTTTLTTIPNDVKSSWHYPTLEWNGFNNQYHHWLSNWLKGDFGTSILDDQSATKKIKSALKWTALLVILNLILALIIAIPLAIISAQYKNTWIDHFISWASLSIYAVPIFWLATLMIVFFTTNTYGNWLNIFPTPSSFFVRADDNFWDLVGKYFSRLILPVICLTMKDIATLTRIIRADIIAESDKDYVRTLQAKGISSWNIMLKHVFPNASIGLTTLIVNNIPSALAGTLIIEVIFNIPGMGRLMYSSIFNSDWSIVFAILMLIGLFTTLFYLLGDIVYKWINPRIRYE